MSSRGDDVKCLEIVGLIPQVFQDRSMLRQSSYESSQHGFDFGCCAIKLVGLISQIIVKRFRIAPKYSTLRQHQLTQDETSSKSPHYSFETPMEWHATTGGERCWSATWKR